MHAPSLERAFQELRDAVDDLASSPSQNSANVLERFVTVFESEQFAKFLSSVLPRITAEEEAAVLRPGQGLVGHGTVNWPHDRAKRVALQVALIQHLAGQHNRLIMVTREYYYSGVNSFTAHIQRFIDAMVRPMLRDLERLAEDRAVSPVLVEAMSTVPKSGDPILDNLIQEAVEKFKDSGPAAQKEGLERLWDAWERLKTVEGADKKVSVGMLLDLAAQERHFREMIETEAKALTSIGNDFHIRHFETSKTPLGSAAQVDYLFHRLYAFIHFLLRARRADAPAS